MRATEPYLVTPGHRELVEELLALETAEDQLTWLMERPPYHRLLSADERTNERKVPGCLSGLWLAADVVDSVCQFRAYSESSVVHGIVSFMCDLYSQRSCSDVAAIGSALTDYLRLDRLLSTTRKRAVSSTLAFFNYTATAHLRVPDVA